MFPRRGDKLKRHSIAVYIILVLLVGLFVPMAGGMIIALNHSGEKLEKELAAFHRESLDIFSVNVEDFLTSFSPEGVKNTAGILFRDDRIVGIEVYSDIFELHLLRVSKQTSVRRFNTVSLTRIIRKAGEDIGRVTIEVDTDWAGPRIEKERNLSIMLFSTMFAGGIMLIVPAIYFRILKPLNRLTRQAQNLSKGQFDTPCTWNGRDELAMLGSTLDEMRSRLSHSFNRMKELAVTDELTGLPNRRGFLLEMRKLIEVSGRYGHPMTIAIMDLDHFKSVNDTYGHGAGDEVLKAFSRIISNNIRKSDLFGRFGGEEFILVMPETDPGSGKILLNKLRKTVCRQTYVHGDVLTVSIGATPFDPDLSLDTLLASADKALYQAKQEGRNRVVVHDSGEDA